MPLKEQSGVWEGAGGSSSIRALHGQFAAGHASTGLHLPTSHSSSSSSSSSIFSSSFINFSSSSLLHISIPHNTKVLAPPFALSLLSFLFLDVGSSLLITR